MQVTELTISGLGPKGDGIHDGSTGRVFVDRAVPGDKLKARVVRGRDDIPRGEIVEITEASELRQTPPCKHYDVCGNCTLQHLTDDYYRSWKTQIVKEALEKVLIRPTNWKKPLFIGSSKRRRATFSVRKDGGKLVMGYYKRRTKSIGDIDACLIADPKILQLREAIKPRVEELLRRDETIDIFLQLVGKAVDMLITGPIGPLSEPTDAIIKSLQELATEAGITRIAWRPDERDEIHTLVINGQVLAQFGPVRVALPSGAFLQPTQEGERALVDAVMAELPEEGTFADLFSGCGTFSGPMLMNGPVDAFESQYHAVAALGKAGRGLPLGVYRRDLYTDPLTRHELNRYDAVVFDPPRAGSPEQTTVMAYAKTPIVIGVSCNPSTFARDARILAEGGYRLQSVQIIDQFQWSHHVELVGVFTKQLKRGKG